MSLNQQAVLDAFRYEKGSLFYREPTERTDVNTAVGSPHHTGYLYCNWNGKQHMLHRLIFLYHNGYLPKEIDHINGDRRDNRIENLRECSRSNNRMNSTLAKNNTSGIKGVQWVPREQKWRGIITVNKKPIYLGSSSCKEDVANMVAVARANLHRDFANDGSR